MRQNGIVGAVRYSMPYLLTPQMWATILTGRTPGSHGVFDYWQRSRDGSFFETRGSDIHGLRIWDVFAKNAVQSGFINVPMTYPPPHSGGFFLSGQDAPGAHPSIAFPRSLYSDITRLFGRYHHKDMFPGGQDKLTYGRLLPNEVRWQTDLFEWLLRRNDWRFLMLYSSGTAFAQHYFWKEMEQGDEPVSDVVEQTYRAYDEMLGRVIAALDPDDTIFLMSECGAGPITSGVHLNNWLCREGFLRYRSKKESQSWRAKFLAGCRTAAQRYLPKKLFYFANSLPVKSWIQGAIAADGIDWSRTHAYHRGKGEGNIYLNVAGRDRTGALPRSDYERVRTDIIERLRTLTDPSTGEPAAAAIHRREELYAGEYIASAPDLIVEWNGFRYMPSESVSSRREVFGDRTREYMKWPTSGSHRPEGILIISGKNVRPAALSRPVNLVDLAPTWLALLNCPLSNSMQGQPVVEILKHASFKPY